MGLATYNVQQTLIGEILVGIMVFFFFIGSATYRICLSVSVCFIFMVYGVSWLANDISVDRVLGSNNNNYS